MRQRVRMLLSSAASALACLLCSGQALAWDYTPTVISNLASVYGYLASQSITLERAAEQYPSMRPEIERTRAEFERQFPAALDAVTRLFQGIPLPATDRARLATKVLEMDRDSIQSALANQQAVRDFLDRVRGTARGEMEPDSLQLLLAAVYDEQPAAELNTPMTRVLRTKGTPAARDADVALRMPRSWERNAAREKLRDDGMIFAFNSQGGSGLSTIDLLTRPLPQAAVGAGEPSASAPVGESSRAAAATASKAAAAETERLATALRFATGTTAKVLAQGTTRLKQRSMTWVSFSVANEGASGRTVQYGRLWLLPLREYNQTMMLVCRTGAVPEATAEAERKRLTPLWEAVAASITVTPPARTQP
jgi:hypothetical protein